MEPTGVEGEKFIAIAFEDDAFDDLLVCSGWRLKKTELNCTLK